MDYEKVVKDLLRGAGIKVNGKNPWDIKVHNNGFYKRMLMESDLGLGESYMDGWWDCDRLDLFVERLLDANLEKTLKHNKALIFNFIFSKLFNPQNRKRAKKVGEVHYDVGNELYTEMLGKTMSYTCGYWKGLKPTPNNLDKAQEQKLDLICKKLKLKKGMKVLDIGCGWGNFAKFAAENYGVNVVGISISKEQVKLGKELCKGLPVEIRFQDYRDINEKFDRIVSIGMFEHVGRKNHREYMRIVSRNLKGGGLSMLHTIGWKETRKFGGGGEEGFLGKYIFPNGDVPSAQQITKSANGLLQLEDWHNFGKDYAKTLRAWHNNFVKSWPKIKNNYDERFFRMWQFYLLMCAGIFEAGTARLWQVVLSKGGKEVYESVR